MGKNETAVAAPGANTAKRKPGRPAKASGPAHVIAEAANRMIRANQKAAEVIRKHM
jgi:hypothetical protein